MKKLFSIILSLALSFNLVLSSFAFETNITTSQVSYISSSQTIYSLFNSSEEAVASLYHTMVTTSTPDIAEVSLYLSLSVGNVPYPIQLSGKVSITEYAPNIILAEGVLEGTTEINGTPCFAAASFYKNMISGKYGAGITLTPDSSNMEEVIFSVGDWIYTEEIKAVHPAYIELRTQLQSFSNASSDYPQQYSMQAIPSGFQYCSGTISYVPNNHTGVSGAGQQVRTYIKEKGDSSHGSGNTNFNIFLVTVNTYSKALSETALSNTIDPGIVRFQQSNISLNSTNTGCYFERFHCTPITSDISSSNSLRDIFGDLLSLLGFSTTSTVANILLSILPTTYIASIDSSTKRTAEYRLSVDVTSDDACFDDTPLCIDFELHAGASQSYPITVTSTTRYMVIRENTAYPITATTTFTANAHCVY